MHEEGEKCIQILAGKHERNRLLRNRVIERGNTLILYITCMMFHDIKSQLQEVNPEVLLSEK
jgi:hypothetical protein